MSDDLYHQHPEAGRTFQFVIRTSDWRVLRIEEIVGDQLQLIEIPIGLYGSNSAQDAIRAAVQRLGEILAAEGTHPMVTCPQCHKTSPRGETGCPVCGTPYVGA